MIHDTTPITAPCGSDTPHVPTSDRCAQCSARAAGLGFTAASTQPWDWKTVLIAALAAYVVWEMATRGRKEVRKRKSLKRLREAE